MSFSGALADHAWVKPLAGRLISAAVADRQHLLFFCDSHNNVPYCESTVFSRWIQHTAGRKAGDTMY